MSKADKETTPVAQATQEATGPRVTFKSEGLKSSYANFVNANSTREEVVLNFGINQDWDRSRKEMEIELSHRIVLSPFAAKRLAAMLQRTALRRTQVSSPSLPSRFRARSLGWNSS